MLLRIFKQKKQENKNWENNFIANRDLTIENCEKFKNYLLKKNKNNEFRVKLFRISLILYSKRMKISKKTNWKQKKIIGHKEKIERMKINREKTKKIKKRKKKIIVQMMIQTLPQDQDPDPGAIIQRNLGQVQQYKNVFFY